MEERHPFYSNNKIQKDYKYHENNMIVHDAYNELDKLIGQKNELDKLIGLRSKDSDKFQITEILDHKFGESSGKASPLSQIRGSI